MEGDLNIRCPKCKSTQTRFRIKTHDHHCYVCNNNWTDEVENE